MKTQGNGIQILAAESMGVRSLCCLVSLSDRRIVIDPGISLGYRRYGLLPHPFQIAVGCSIRNTILEVLATATDVVFSHFHGDHIPLLDANPYQLSMGQLPTCFSRLRCWSKSDEALSPEMSKRYHDLVELLGDNMRAAEGGSYGPLSFSRDVPHGHPDSNLGTLMMTRIETDHGVFVHASDIQLLDDTTVAQIIDWGADIVLAAGPPLYLDRLSKTEREYAWINGTHLAYHIDTVILDHHLMRSEAGAIWLDELSDKVGKKVYCAADFMDRNRELLEAKRLQLYQRMPVPDSWHEDYANGRLTLEFSPFFNKM